MSVVRGVAPPLNALEPLLRESPPGPRARAESLRVACCNSAYTCRVRLAEEPQPFHIPHRVTPSPQTDNFRTGAFWKRVDLPIRLLVLASP